MTVTDDDAIAMLPRAHRVYVIAMTAIIAGMFAYAASEWGQWPRLTYLPLSGDLTLDPTTQVSVTFLGNVAWGLGAALCGAALGAVLTRVFPRPWPERVLLMFGAWAITAILLAGGYFTWSLWPW